jgi:predicted metalloprotease with PDZ domain
MHFVRRGRRSTPTSRHEAIVEEQRASSASCRISTPGHYTFSPTTCRGAAATAWSTATAPSSRRRSRSRTPRTGLLGTVAHEFFHVWNVERIRPAGLEPFDFEEANMTDGLWLAEGFTSYYGPLTMHRAGLVPLDQTLGGFGGMAGAVVNGPGRQFRSAVEMSRWAPFADAARSVDQTNQSYTFISYYTWGAALGLALDLELRIRSNGKVSLDEYMRRLWTVHGKPGGSRVGYVDNPYTMEDARARLAEASGDRAFADDFFARYIEGREAPDYARLLEPAGVVVRPRNPGRAWIGAPVDANGRVTQLVAWGTPAFEAGLEQDAVITRVGEGPASDLAGLLKSSKPGDRIAIAFTRRSGEQVTGTLVLGEDPSLAFLPVERSGGTLTPAQKTFREAWLGSKVRR